MEEFDIKISKHQIGTKGAKIAVIGVGGAGGNMLDTKGQKLRFVLFSGNTQNKTYLLNRHGII